MPKQSTSQAIGHEGERWFAAQLPPKWIPQFPRTDVGVDLQIIVCEDGPLNGLEFRVQVKSANHWKLKDDCILLGGFRKTSLIDLLRGFTPSLLVLYQASSKSGWCFWLNQLLARNPFLVRGTYKTTTLKVPTNRPINSNLWPQLGSELRGVTTALGHRIVLSGLSLPILEATRSLMQSLHLIDLCANGNGSNTSFSELLDAEMTAHKEIVTTLLELDRALVVAGGLIVGIAQVAERYIETCEQFLPGFSTYVQQSTAGVTFRVAPELMVRHRPEAVRMVTQVVERLTMLTLQGTQAMTEHNH